MAPPLGPRRASVAYAFLPGASFLDLLLVVCCGPVLASHWMTVELLRTRLVARDGRPRRSSLPGGVAFRRSSPFRYLPTLCYSSFLRTRPTLRNGSPLLRRSALAHCVALEPFVFYGWIALWQPVAYASPLSPPARAAHSTNAMPVGKIEWLRGCLARLHYPAHQVAGGTSPLLRFLRLVR
jgi:hypothetical protein